MESHEFNRVKASVLCVCGEPEQSVAHPHGFKRNYGAKPAGSETRCLCTLPLAAPIHIWKTEFDNQESHE